MKSNVALEEIATIAVEALVEQGDHARVSCPAEDLRWMAVEIQALRAALAKAKAERDLGRARTESLRRPGRGVAGEIGVDMAVKNKEEVLQAIKKAEDNLESAKKELRLGGSIKSTKFYLARTIEASTEALYHMEPSES